MELWPPSFEATGDHVSVVELSPAHEADLVEAAADGELYRLWYTMIPKPDGVRAEIVGRRLNAANRPHNLSQHSGHWPVGPRLHCWHTLRER